MKYMGRDVKVMYLGEVEITVMSRSRRVAVMSLGRQGQQQYQGIWRKQ